jgi:hypothetical protein
MHRATWKRVVRFTPDTLWIYGPQSGTGLCEREKSFGPCWVLNPDSSVVHVVH